MEIENKIDQTYTEDDETVEEEVGLIEAPYLPSLPKESADKIYTLVLDLDETLVHYEEVRIKKKFI
jgi:predicted HAD superfamily phosphohydrolase YqeG